VKKICGIYKITCIDNDKVYIGQSIDIKRRWSNHRSKLNNNKHDNDYLQKAWNKYGSLDFTHEIIEILPHESNQTLINYKECYWINYYNALNKQYGFNLAQGGSCGNPFINKTEEEMEIWKNKIKETKSHEYIIPWNKGMQLPQMSGKNHPMFGKHLSEETKQKISKSNKGRKMSKETKLKVRGENHHMFGKHLSEETKMRMSISKKGEKHNMYNKHLPKEWKQKISKALKGRAFSDETKKKISESKKGQIHTIETREKISKSNKGKFIGKNNPRAMSVICITTGKIFDTAKEGSEFYKISPSSIGQCCKIRKKSVGKHAITGEPLVWIYYKDYITILIYLITINKYNTYIIINNSITIKV
jgi:group I intron endonuclease